MLGKKNHHFIYVLCDNNAINLRHSNNARSINVLITDDSGYIYECVYRISSVYSQPLNWQELRKEKEEIKKQDPNDWRRTQ
jgi:hypothetical protein